MFQQLVPLLRHRSVLLTVTLVEDDQVRVNVMPKKLADSENNALSTPMSFTGTAAELDEQLPAAISSFVASHLQLKNTLSRAKEEMEAAAKSVQEEARNKARKVKKPATETMKKMEPAAKEEPEKPEPPRMVGLFDRPAEASATNEVATRLAAATPSQASRPSATNGQSEEEEEILAEIAEDDSEEDTAA